MTPACKRAVEVAIEAVSGAGCEIVYYRPPNLEVISHYFFDHMLADAGANSLPMWKNEILDQVMFFLKTIKARYFEEKKSNCFFAFEFLM